MNELLCQKKDRQKILVLSHITIEILSTLNLVIILSDVFYISFFLNLHIQMVPELCTTSKKGHLAQKTQEQFPLWTLQLMRQ